jgi:hypothetical protein
MQSFLRITLLATCLAVGIAVAVALALHKPPAKAASTEAAPPITPIGTTPDPYRGLPADGQQYPTREPIFGPSSSRSSLSSQTIGWRSPSKSIRRSRPRLRRPLPAQMTPLRTIGPPSLRQSSLRPRHPQPNRRRRPPDRFPKHRCRRLRSPSRCLQPI